MQPRDNSQTPDVTVFTVESGFIFAESINRTCLTQSEELKDLASYLREKMNTLISKGIKIALHRNSPGNPFLQIGDFRITTSEHLSDSPFTLALTIEGVAVTLVKDAGYYTVCDTLNRIVEANPERY